MDSGKTTRLIQEAHNYEERGQQVVVMKPSTDTKGESKITSRIGLEREVDILISREGRVRQLLSSWMVDHEVQCVFVDEVQFLEPPQVDELLRFTVESKIPVITYGLRTDFQLKGFPGSTRLLEVAHNIEEIPTICRCGHKARCNGRKINGQFVFHGQQVAIDGENSVEYESLCPACFLEEADKAGVKIGV